MAYQFPLNGGRINASLAGNSTSAGAGYKVVSTGTLILAGGNNITLSQNGQSISIVGGGGGGGIALSAGTQSVSTGTVNFANSNGISFGMSGSNQITASHNGITSQSAQTIGGYVSGNTTGQSSSSTFDARSMSMSGVGAVSLGYSASMLQVSAPNQSSLSQTGALSISRSGSTISIGVPAVSMGMSNIGNTSGTSGTVSNQLILAGGNNIMLSQATGAGGNTISISASAQTVQTQSNIQGIIAGASTNYTGNISFANSYGVSFGLSNNTVTASVAAGGGGGGGGGVAIVTSNTSYTSGSVFLSNAGGALTIATAANQSLNFSVPNQSTLSATGAVSLSANGNTLSIGVNMLDVGVSNAVAGGTTYGNMMSNNTGGLILYAGSNIGLSQATDVVGNASVTILAAGGAVPLTRWEYPNQVFASIPGGIANSSLSVQKINLPTALSAASMRLAVSAAMTSYTSATAMNFGVSMRFGVYTLNSTNLSLLSSVSTGYNYALSSGAGYSSSYNGVKEISAAMPLNLSAGDYWLGAMVSSSTNYAGGSVSLSMMGNSAHGSAGNVGFFGSVTTAGRDAFLAMGIYSANTGALANPIPVSAINNVNASYMQRAAFYHVLYNSTY